MTSAPPTFSFPKSASSPCSILRTIDAEPLYQMPPLALYIFEEVSVSLGIARRALDDLTELAQAKVPSLYSDVLADKAITQVELARAEASLGGARSFVYETAEDMWQTVSAGRPPARASSH